MLVEPGLRVYQVLPLAAYLACYPALWCLAQSLCPGRGTAYAVCAAGFWVGLEYLRAHAGPLAFSLATLSGSPL